MSDTNSTKHRIEVFDGMAAEEVAAPATGGDNRLAEITALANELTTRRDMLKERIQAQEKEAQLAAEDLKNMTEKTEKAKDDAQKAGAQPQGEKEPTVEEILAQYGRDLTQAARNKELDPVIGREPEIKEVSTTLMQRGRSNVMLLGEPGIGKTALFSAFAQQVVDGNVPDALKDAKVFTLDLNAMVSGAAMQGEFEKRLLGVVKAVSAANQKGDKIILCIDEMHSALKAGGVGNGGAGQILKPYLTSGNLKIIGATTQSEYAEHIQNDKALDRRFQALFISPPTDEQTIEILKGLKKKYADHHKIAVDDAKLEKIVQLTSRYLTNLYQPDKSINMLDNACARAVMAGEKELTDEQIIKSVAISSHISEEFLKSSDSDRYLDVCKQLPKEVIDQNEATGAVGMALLRAKAKLNDPKKPLGSFLFLGPSGVGKTETARALARLLHGNEDALIRVDMSDYQERHETAKLVGAPPGYVGYGEEGFLTGAVRRKPFSIVLLDEMEKAHPEVQKRLLQVLEEGELVDSRGVKISFRNTIIIMTSNTGAHAAMEQAQAKGITAHEDPEEWKKVTQPFYEQGMKQVFLPEFLGRVGRKVIFNPLSPDSVALLVERQLGTVTDRLQSQWHVGLSLDPEAQAEIARAGYSPRYGARHLKSAVDENVVDPLALWLAENGDKVEAQAKEGGMEIAVSGIGSLFGAEVRKAFNKAANDTGAAVESATEIAVTIAPKRPRRENG